MLKSLKTLKKNKLNLSFLGVIFGLLLTKGIGFIRQIIILPLLGATSFGDIYAMITTVPGTIFNQVGLSLSHVNMADIIHYDKQDKQKRNEYFTEYILKTMVISFIVSLILMIFSKQITHLLIKNLAYENRHLAYTCTRLIVWTFSAVLISMSTRGILQAHGHYTLSTLVSIPFNFIIIITALIYSNSIVVICLSFTVGWFLQLFIQIPILRKEGYRFTKRTNEIKAKVNKNLSLLPPIIISNIFIIACFYTDKIFAGYIGEGYQTILNTGSETFFILITTIVSTITTVIFPKITKYCVENDYEKVKQLLGHIYKILISLSIPFVLTIIIIGSDLINFMYGRGEFTHSDIILISNVFIFYSFSIFGYIAHKILGRVFFAQKRFIIQMTMSIIFFTANIIINLLVYRPFGIRGICISTSIVFFIYSIAIIIILSKSIGSFLGKDFIKYIIKLWLPSIVFGLCLFSLKRFYYNPSIIIIILYFLLSAILFLVVGYKTNFKQLYKENKSIQNL